MPDLSGLYPQPPQQNQGLLSGGPGALIGTLEGLQRLQILGQQASALGQQPAASLAGTNIVNQTALMQQQNEARRIVQGYIANSLAGIEKPNQGDVFSALSHATTVFPDIVRQYPDIWTSTRQSLLDGPDIGRNVGMLLNSTLSPGEASSLVAGPPTASGAPTQMPLTASNMQGPRVTGTPPGFAERAAGGAAIDTKLAGNLADSAEGSPARIGILGNLEDTVGKFTTGPGADWTKVAKSFINRNVPLPQGWQFDPGSIASQEEFNKQAMQLAQQQFSAIGGTGTDAKFASAFETSPNETLSNLGNRGIIRLLKGNEDALQAKNEAWLKTADANPNASYRAFSQQFNSHFDPRIFQFKYLNPNERKDYVSKMDPQDQQRFLYNMTVARKNGWVNYDLGK